MSLSNILILFIFFSISVEGEKEIVFEMDTDWQDVSEYNVTSKEKKSDHNSLVCYLKCKSDKNEFLHNGTIVLNMVNIFSDEKLFILDGAIRNAILECMGSNLSMETCGENYSRCKPLITKPSNIPDENSTCCLRESTLNISNLDWYNFLGFSEETDCLMKCIKVRESIFNEKGEAVALNVYTNTEFVDIIPEKRENFRRCVLNGSGVHTCKEIIYLYICFFRNISKAYPRKWLYN